MIVRSHHVVEHAIKVKSNAMLQNKECDTHLDISTGIGGSKCDTNDINDC